MTEETKNILLGKTFEELCHIWTAYERRQNDEDPEAWLLPEEIEEMEFVEDLIHERSKGFIYSTIMENEKRLKEGAGWSRR